MKRFKKICTAGLAAFMLSFSLWGMSAEAVTVSCTHSWTVEVEEVKEWKETHKTNEGEICTITYVDTYYNEICRSCGKLMGERLDSRTSHHSVAH